MKDIPLHRVAILKPFTDFLADIGANYEQGFRQAKLPITALDNVNLYIPSHRFWSFCGYMARREGIDDLGFLVGKKYGAYCADPNFHKVLSRSPTLYHALETTCKLIDKTTSRSKIWLHHPADFEGIRIYHQSSFDSYHPSINQMDWFALMGIIGIIQLFTGPRWRPSQMGLITKKKPGNAIREYLPDTHILTSQQTSYVTVENSQLYKPPLSQLNEPAKTILKLDAMNYDTVPNDFAGRFKDLMKSYYMDFHPTLDMSAEICDLKKRTLQRYLTSNGSSFNQVMNEVRYDIGKNLLLDPDMEINDVARALRYSDSAHFARAFRRISGVSPSEYRRAQVVD